MYLNFLQRTCLFFFYNILKRKNCSYSTILEKEGQHVQYKVKAVSDSARDKENCFPLPQREPLQPQWCYLGYASISQAYPMQTYPSPVPVEGQEDQHLSVHQPNFSWSSMNVLSSTFTTLLGWLKGLAPASLKDSRIGLPVLGTPSNLYASLRYRTHKTVSQRG